MNLPVWRACSSAVAGVFGDEAGDHAIAFGGEVIGPVREPGAVDDGGHLVGRPRPQDEAVGGQLGIGR
ncbi:hypothetical protein [Actinoallomurus vinaceus]|uniref:hypothetical protein n=1 Tax=Actinoallomurus vinaceus TaxID=1080074 RepID=UPI0031ECB202